MSLPWYKDGLRFKCTECGKCCTGQAGYVWVSEEEIESMAKHLKIETKAFKVKYIRRKDNKMALIEKKLGDGNKACIFLEGKLCTLYQSRPKQCRTFPWWKENLNSEVSWKIASLDCEGINDNAPIIPLAEIEKNLSTHS